MTKRIRVTMLDRDDTVADICRAAGISPSTWYHRRSHPDSWRLGELRAVAHFLNVPLSTLVAIDG